MMTLRAIFSASLLLLANSLYGAATPITASNIYEHSELWPFYVQVDTEAAGLKAGGGFPAVLNRIDVDGSALIDFGRDGLHSVSLVNTDVIDRANQIQQGLQIKELPNLIRYTTNMFVDYSEDGESSLRASDDLQQAKCLLIVYCDQSVLQDQAQVAALHSLKDHVRTLGGYELFIPTRLAFYDAIVEGDLKDINMMVPHMSIAHVKSLGHAPALDGAVTCVLIDTEGKILHDWRIDAEDVDASGLLSIEAEVSRYWLD
jgi:hypothetical protein